MDTLAFSVSDIFTFEVFFNALTLGALYALIAVGYTMVYGIIKLINFAHGEIFMMGTFLGLLLMTNASMPLALAMLAAMAACVILGVVIDFSAYLPLRRQHPLADNVSLIGLGLISVLTLSYFFGVRSDVGAGGMAVIGILLGAVPLAVFVIAILGLLGRLGRPKGTVQSDRLSALITAIGMSLALQTIAQLVFGADPRPIPDEVLPSFMVGDGAKAFVLGGTQVTFKEIIIWVSAVGMMVGLEYIVQYTRIGKAMRACALDKDTASLMGVNVNYVIAVTFMIGSAMAAVAGLLYAIKVGGNVYFRMGYYPGVIAFAAAVLGGIGNIRGAMLGGLLIGLTEAIGVAIAPEYKFAFAFGLMIAVILFRPWGLLGKAGAKRA